MVERDVQMELTNSFWRKSYDFGNWLFTIVDFPVAKTLGADHVYKACTFKNLVVCLNKLELWSCAKLDACVKISVHS
jgi:hypothetical protein